MKPEDYVMQYAQDNVEAPAQRKTLEELAADFDEEKNGALVALLDAELSDDFNPADVLHRLALAAFGEHSPQVAAVEKATMGPGGPELALATIEAQKTMIKNRIKKLQEMISKLNGDLKRLDNEAHDIKRFARDTLDKAFMEIMELSLSPEPPTLAELTALYEHHKGNRRAMGLLCGLIGEVARRELMAFDMVDAQRLHELQERVIKSMDMWTTPDSP